MASVKTTYHQLKGTGTYDTYFTDHSVVYSKKHVHTVLFSGRVIITVDVMASST